MLIANLIAWPIAWWALNGWLNGFTYRITLGPVLFLIASVTVLVLAMSTVAGHAFAVARAKPIAALRYE